MPSSLLWFVLTYNSSRRAYFLHHLVILICHEMVISVYRFQVQMGHFGDVAPVGEGVSELRIFYGPGYRVYFVQRGPVVVILLSGGDKSSQEEDIAKAKEIARQLEV